MLLTKDERRSLDGEGRRTLRKARRAERPAKNRLVLVDLAALRRRAAALVMDYAGEAIPGPDKMDEVLDDLASEADRFIQWQWLGPVGLLLEAADGPALNALVHLALRPHVQRVYDALRDAGVVTPS